MIALFLAAMLFVTNCPVVQEGTCASTFAMEAHQTIVWGQPEVNPWICDGSVWWEAVLDGQDKVEFRCKTTPLPNGDSLISCPDSIAPVKYWNRSAGQSAWLRVTACNSAGCSTYCEVEIIWPAYTCFYGAC